jgi:hypothetical protein
MLTSQEIDIADSILASFNTKISKIEGSITNCDPFGIVDSTKLLEGYNKIYFYKLYELLDLKDITRLSVVKVKWTEPDGRYFVEKSDLQLVGIKKLESTYGHLFIRPETIEDKVSELFKRTEIDYRDFPKFSSRYFFTSNNEVLAHNFATNARLTLIEKQNEIFIEVSEDLLIAKFLRKINQSDVESMIDFLAKI